MAGKRSKVIGIDHWIDTVGELSWEGYNLSSMALYDGASVLTDGIRDAIKNISPRSGGYGQYWIGVTDVERQGLLDGLGIATHKQKNGKVDTKIGFAGYNDYVTKKYPNGHPNSLVARSLESGTSWLHKTPFIAPTVRRLRKSVVQAMQLEIDKYIRQKEKKK